jgi:drug/metabolite transporter (DMT)-like permease
MKPENLRAKGIVLVTAAAVLWSTAGFFVRLIDLDVWTVLGWRSLFAALSLALMVMVRKGRPAMGRPGICAIPVAAVSMGAYVVALKLTTVANVMIVYATVPFVAAAAAYLWSGERASPRVLVASLIAAIGVAVMAGFAMNPRDIAGNAVAFLMTLAFAVQLVMARRYPSLDMAPTNAAAAALCAVLCWPLMAAEIPSAAQLAIIALFGVTTTSLAYLLFMTGGRHIPSSEAGLIGLLDVVLGPMWVWLAFSERPSAAALVGGGMVLGAVLWCLRPAAIAAS